VCVFMCVCVCVCVFVCYPFHMCSVSIRCYIPSGANLILFVCILFNLVEKGYGYYNVNTREANGVLIGRCERMIRDNYNSMVCWGFPIVFFLIPFEILVNIFLTKLWILWIVLGICFLLMVFIALYFLIKKKRQLEEVKDAAMQRKEEALDPNVHTFYVGAAACGFIGGGFNGGGGWGGSLLGCSGPGGCRGPGGCGGAAGYGGGCGGGGGGCGGGGGGGGCGGGGGGCGGGGGGCGGG
jgi:hypothetical protein